MGFYRVKVYRNGEGYRGKGLSIFLVIEVTVVLILNSRN